MKKYFGLTFIMMLAGLASEAAGPVIVNKLTFDQARQITWQNSHVLKQAGYLQLQKNQERNAAKGLYYPTIGIAASAMATPPTKAFNRVS